MIMSLLALALEEVHLRELPSQIIISLMHSSDKRDRANLASSGYSVFLIEAGGDGSDDFVERIPSMYGSLQPALLSLTLREGTLLPLRTLLTPGNST